MRKEGHSKDIISQIKEYQHFLKNHDEYSTSEKQKHLDEILTAARKGHEHKAKSLFDKMIMEDCKRSAKEGYINALLELSYIKPIPKNMVLEVYKNAENRVLEFYKNPDDKYERYYNMKIGNSIYLKIKKLEETTGTPIPKSTLLKIVEHNLLEMHDIAKLVELGKHDLKDIVYFEEKKIEDLDNLKQLLEKHQYTIPEKMVYEGIFANIEKIWKLRRIKEDFDLRSLFIFAEEWGLRSKIIKLRFQYLKKFSEKILVKPISSIKGVKKLVLETIRDYLREGYYGHCTWTEFLAEWFELFKDGSIYEFVQNEYAWHFLHADEFIKEGVRSPEIDDFIEFMKKTFGIEPNIKKISKKLKGKKEEILNLYKKCDYWTIKRLKEILGVTAPVSIFENNIIKRLFDDAQSFFNYIEEVVDINLLERLKKAVKKEIEKITKEQRI